MILNRQRSVRVGRRSLELFLRRLRKHLALGQADLTVCLVSDSEIVRMNETFRKKKGPTDVLSFPSRERAARKVLGRAAKGSGARRAPAPAGSRMGHAEYLGDIAISPATARRNAQRYGRSLPSELQVLTLHGVLHLLGYDHETDHGQMNRLERRLRQKLGLT
jgi:probable rRNA maturation factor